MLASEKNPENSSTFWTPIPQSITTFKSAPNEEEGVLFFRGNLPITGTWDGEHLIDVVQYRRAVRNGTMVRVAFDYAKKRSRAMYATNLEKKATPEIRPLPSKIANIAIRWAGVSVESAMYSAVSRGTGLVVDNKRPHNYVYVDTFELEERSRELPEGNIRLVIPHYESWKNA